MQYLEMLPDGQAYILFYLKLLAKSIKKEGRLRFNDEMPYTEALLARFTGTDPQLVSGALEALESIKLIERKPDGTIFMCQLEDMVGYETTSTERVRKHRQLKALHETEENVSSAFPCNTEIEKEKEIETETELYPEKEEDLPPELQRKQEQRREKAGADAPCLPAGAENEGDYPLRPYGRYGWVKLSHTQYDHLVGELGFDEATRCIDYVDEMAQGNGNKNKWRDWEVVVRKCHREGWGVRSPRKDNGFKTGNPFLEMLAEMKGESI